jgi:hypothetical protein
MQTTRRFRRQRSTEGRILPLRQPQHREALGRVKAPLASLAAAAALTRPRRFLGRAVIGAGRRSGRRADPLCYRRAATRSRLRCSHREDRWFTFNARILREAQSTYHLGEERWNLRQRHQ